LVTGDQPIHELIGALYEAAACPERWQDFLRLVADCFAAEMSGISMHSSDHASAVQQSFNIDPEGVREYDLHYGATNPTITPIFKELRKNRVWHGLARSIVPEDEFRRTEYYNDWGRKYGSYSSALGVIGTGPSEMTALSIVRSNKKPLLPPDCVGLMGLLMPHLQRAVKTHRAMESLRSKCGAAVSALDALDTALVAVNGIGEVVLINQKAGEILQQKRGLILAGKKLAATYSQNTRDLDRLVMAAAATGAGRGLHPGGAVLVYGQAGPALQISILPFHSSHMLTEVTPCALIFIVDPKARLTSRKGILSILFRLTPAECRLADCLLQGLELAGAAESMRITNNTARFMLKSIFRKTETHRQSELLRLLLRLPSSQSDARAQDYLPLRMANSTFPRS
jgi:DNA-binding CsgD family transcriptional regulator